MKPESALPFDLVFGLKLGLEVLDPSVHLLQDVPGVLESLQLLKKFATLLTKLTDLGGSHLNDQLEKIVILRY